MSKRFGTIAHLLTGFVLVLKGYAKITDHYPVTGSIILVFGLAIFGYVYYEKRQQLHSQHLQMLVHFFEGLALLFTTYVYIDEGKSYIQYVTFAAGIGMFVTVYILYRKQKKQILPAESNPVLESPAIYESIDTAPTVSAPEEEQQETK